MLKVVMKRMVVTLLPFLIFFSNSSQAETDKRLDSLCLELKVLSEDVVNIKSYTLHQLSEFGETQEILNVQIDSLREQCIVLDVSQKENADGLSSRIEGTNDSLNTRTRVLQSKLAEQASWGVVLVVIIVLIIAIAVLLLCNKVRKGKISINEVRKVQEGMLKAQTSLQEESIKLDSKLVELIEAQINATPQETGSKEPDHSLTQKVADEIVRMEMNLSRMDPSVKGHKQLSKAVGRIKDNFKANGYEIVDMLGKPYNEGMKVVANFVADESLDEGKQIITGITKPQINYNGKMIQAAQITVSQNI